MKNLKTERANIKREYLKRIKDAKKNNFCGYGVEYTPRKLKNYIAKLEREQAQDILKLEQLEQADTLRYIKIKIEWHKSPVWGYNPRAEVWTSGGFYGTGTASGCGYDKESSAVEVALRNSPALKRWIIENKGKIKDCYGTESNCGAFHLSIAGKGMCTLTQIFRKFKCWKITEEHGKTWDFYEFKKD